MRQISRVLFLCIANVLAHPVLWVIALTVHAGVVHVEGRYAKAVMLAHLIVYLGAVAGGSRLWNFLGHVSAAAPRDAIVRSVRDGLELAAHLLLMAAAWALVVEIEPLVELQALDQTAYHMMKMTFCGGSALWFFLSAYSTEPGE